MSFFNKDVLDLIEYDFAVPFYKIVSLKIWLIDSIYLLVIRTLSNFGNPLPK